MRVPRPRTGTRPDCRVDRAPSTGELDRDELFSTLRPVEERLGRPIQVTIRSARWLDEGDGAFHNTVQARPTVEVPVSTDDVGDGSDGR